MAAELDGCDAMVALLSPQAVSGAGLDDLARARFGEPRVPIVPVMALTCEIPLIVFRLQYVDLREWRSPQYADGFRQLIDGIDRVLAAAKG